MKADGSASDARRVPGAASGDINEICNHLLNTIKGRLPQLRDLLAEQSGEDGYEDPVYRFWHQSYKVYRLQIRTEAIVAALQDLLPGCALNPWFTQIVTEGTTQRFDYSHNDDWLAHTRPIVEAFFHARFMLEMAVQYGEALERSPTLLPSGWAALLYLYELR